MASVCSSVKQGYQTCTGNGGSVRGEGHFERNHETPLTIDAFCSAPGFEESCIFCGERLKTEIKYILIPDEKTTGDIKNKETRSERWTIENSTTLSEISKGRQYKMLATCGTSASNLKATVWSEQIWFLPVLHIHKTFVELESADAPQHDYPESRWWRW